MNDSVFDVVETKPVLMINAGGSVRQIASAKDKGFGPLAYYKGLGLPAMRNRVIKEN